MNTNKFIHNYLNKQRAREKASDIKKSDATLDDKINRLQTLVDNTRNDVKDIYNNALGSLQNQKTAEEKKARESAYFEAPEQKNPILAVAFDKTYDAGGQGLARAVGERNVDTARQMEAEQSEIAMARKQALVLEKEETKTKPVTQEHLAPVSLLGGNKEKTKKKLGGGL